MDEVDDALTIAEAYLDEMLEADRVGDYEGFIKNFDKNELEAFTEEHFHEDIEQMRESFGPYQSRCYLGSLAGLVDDQHPKNTRFVWRAIYEENEALIIVGIHEIDGVWYVNESTVS